MSNAQPIIRTIQPSDFSKVLEINNSNVPAVGELTLEKLHYLVEHSLHALVVEYHTICGFCITFAPNAPYDSVNYQWFQDSYSDFVYLDRIAFNHEAQGKGFGKLLYSYIEQSMSTGVPRHLCCEVNTEPPNPGSLRFHQSIGFEEVGKLSTQPNKCVCLLRKWVPLVS
jgi:predicted GNAT superfamily acetyltransferase